jgi:DNA mismatch repair ATPase MutS
MKTGLLYKQLDLDQQPGLPVNAQILTQDLELNTLFCAMARDDKFILEVVRKTVLSGTNDPDTVLYRQHILKDCLKNPGIVRDLYTLSIAALESEKKRYFSSKYPFSILYRSLDILRIILATLKKIRSIADHLAGNFVSEGFIAFYQMLRRELSDEYFLRVQDHLRNLEFHEGIFFSAELGKGNKGDHYRLCQAPVEKQNWVQRIFTPSPLPAFTIQINDRDESGARALSDLKDQGLNQIANTLAQSIDHILAFFSKLRTELAFYIGCLNLQEQLAQKKLPLAFPLPAPASERMHSFQGLYDICLALRLEEKVADNELNANGKDLVVITGANQGGKSTFLRSIGIAQLMLQCGMFVPAETFRANVATGLFTHYSREEDATMHSGKLDEELCRMSDIVDHLTPNSLLLLNESFAATNEREGSEIAKQITAALLEKGIKIFFVTHLYEFAHSCYAANLENALFLRAERQNDGLRTFKIRAGEPLQTSFGEDLYDKIFVTGGSFPSAP